MEQETIFGSFAFLRFPWCWRSWCRENLPAAGNRQEIFVSLAMLLHGKRCSQFTYTDFLQLCLLRDQIKEGNTVEVPLTSSILHPDLGSTTLNRVPTSTIVLGRTLLIKVCRCKWVEPTSNLMCDRLPTIRYLIPRPQIKTTYMM